MKHTLWTIALGLAAGMAGALVVKQLSAPLPAVAVLSAPKPMRDAPPMVVPPGWDARYLSRLATVEERVNALDAANKPQATPAATAKEEEREAHYLREQETQNSKLATHQQEPLDASWAGTQEQSMRDALSVAGNRPQPQAIRIDCRSKSCVADATFASPSEALVYLRNVPPVPHGCQGVTSTPMPPSSDGAYTLTFIYNCR